MLRASVGIGRVAGIEIRTHYTSALAFVLVAFSTARIWFPNQSPGYDSTAYALMGTSAAALLFASVLLHELSHAIVARARGQEPRGIMLFVFGGVSDISEATAPMDEFLISIAGPFSSFALAAAFWVGRGLVQPGTPVGEIVTYLALVNLLLGAFNLLPVSPLDGGRVLRSVVWQATGSSTRATLFCLRIGQLLAAVLVGFGVSAVFAGQTFNGLWLAVVGWLLATLMGRTQLQKSRQDALRGFRVGDLMDTRPAYASPDLTVEEFVREHALRGGRLELMVLDAGRLAGMVNVAGASTVAQERWSTTAVTRIMRRAPLPVLRPDEGVVDVLDVLTTAPFAQLPVVVDERVVGMFGREDVTRFRWLSSKLRLPEARRKPR